MDRRKSASRDHDAPRTPRRKAKQQQQGSAVFVILAILGVVVLLGAGGAVGAVLYVKSSRTPAPVGDVKPADKGPKLAELSDRFVGNWEGESPERPAVKVYFEVTRSRVTLKAHNARVNEWGERLHSWRPVRAEGNSLIAFCELEGGEKRQFEWTVVFTSDDAMSVSESGRLIANFRRVVKK